ncbi:MAG: helix-turn-helix domain-containing protein [Ruminococcus sp.]|nr:helix-turn-helix domain-containing protein [Ruminococcus sp.]
MEFSEKLQKLRKSKNMTQEQLAQQLYVSRTAISKWESDRGYPNIDSLKAISKFFNVSIDELLSGDELIEVCEKESETKVLQVKSVVFAALDVMAFLLLILPLFKTEADGVFYSVNILSLTSISSYMKIIYISLICLCGLFGIANIMYTLLQREKLNSFFRYGSITISALMILLFLWHSPYAVAFALFILLFKGFLLVKKS